MRRPTSDVQLPRINRAVRDNKLGQAVPSWEFGVAVPALGDARKWPSGGNDLTRASYPTCWRQRRTSDRRDEALLIQDGTLSPQRRHQRNSCSDADLLVKTCAFPTSPQKKGCVSEDAWLTQVVTSISSPKSPQKGRRRNLRSIEPLSHSCGSSLKCAREKARSTSKTKASRFEDEKNPSLRTAIPKDSDVGNTSSDEEQATPSTAASSQDTSFRVSSPRQFPIVEGCPSFRDALQRLRSGDLFAREFARVRQAYQRFAGDDDLNKDRLGQILAHLGHIISQDLIKTEAENLTDMSTFDAKELDSFVQNYAAHEPGMIKDAFDKQAGLRTSISLDQSMSVLRDLDIMVLRSTLVDLQGRAGLAHADHFDFDGVLRIIAAYRSCEGFTLEELEKAREAFDEAADHRGLIVTDMPNALIDFFGVHCITQLRIMLESAGEAVQDKAYPANIISYHEFLIWARTLQNAEILGLFKAFKDVDDDEDGNITFDEMISLMSRQGFTLLNSEADECLQEAGFGCKKQDGLFGFDDAVIYLNACRKSEGFTNLAHEELISVYNKFDTEGEGEITTSQVLDLLRYLGYQVQIDEVDRYVKQVDFNGNGTMDVDEYLRLMRLHREAEVKQVKTVFRRLISGQREVSKTLVCDAIQALNCCPEDCSEFDKMCKRAIDSSTESALGMPFDTFMSLADQGRKAVKLERRRRANFSEAEFALLQDAWTQFDIQGKGYLEQKQVILLMHRCGLAVHTEAGRRNVFELLEKARAAAQEDEFSEEEVGEQGSGKITFCVMIHAWRMIARENECHTLACTHKARDATHFSNAEVEEFHTVFMTWLKKSARSTEEEEQENDNPPAIAFKTARRGSVPDLRGAQQLSSQSADVSDASEIVGPESALTLASVLGLDNNKKMLPFEALRALLGSLKLRLSPKLLWTLEAKVAAISLDMEHKISFPDFLYLMRWMLDTDFAGLNEVTASAVKHALYYPSSHSSASPPHFSSALPPPAQASRPTARRGSV